MIILNRSLCQVIWIWIVHRSMFGTVLHSRIHLDYRRRIQYPKILFHSGKIVHFHREWDTPIQKKSIKNFLGIYLLCYKMRMSLLHLNYLNLTKKLSRSMSHPPVVFDYLKTLAAPRDLTKINRSWYLCLATIFHRKRRKNSNWMWWFFINRLQLATIPLGLVKIPSLMSPNSSFSLHLRTNGLPPSPENEAKIWDQNLHSSFLFVCHDHLFVTYLCKCLCLVRHLITMKKEWLNYPHARALIEIQTKGTYPHTRSSHVNWNGCPIVFGAISPGMVAAVPLANRFSSKSLGIYPPCPKHPYPSRTQSIGCHRNCNLVAVNRLYWQFPTIQPVRVAPTMQHRWIVHLCSSSRG